MGRSRRGAAASARTTPAEAEPVAIVGASARLPGAPDLEAYWDLLASGRDAVSEIPEGRWSKRFFFHPDRHQPGKSYTWAAGTLGEVADFDAAFFGMSPREADQVDPQQRLLLELTWEALEDAGLPTRAIAGSQAGVYIGFSSAEYANIRMGDPSWMDAYFMTGTTASIAANRLSYAFDLHGPSFVVDTACSSSLVAVAQAVKALRTGEVPLAIAGAANLLLSPYPYIGFCRASMLSPSGRCHAFDARADGYVRAEGAGVVILKRLSDAEADGDEIRGMILGAGVNSDGRTVGLSLPNGAAQAALLRETYAAAGVTPDELAFVEAHGTGTAAGDPIEAGALGEILGVARAGPLPIGSAKTNVGHLETASGMAGLFKAMLALERRQLPGSLHFDTPNPAIDFAALNLRVATGLTSLAGQGRLVAGVNSFGFGGTNAHVILANAPERADLAAAAGGALPPLLLSARSQEALAELTQTWRARLADDPQPAALVRGAARRRDHHRRRLWARGDAPDSLTAALEMATSAEAVTGDLAFVFSGNGAQWAGMGADALRLSPAFRAGVALADTALAPWLGWSALQALEGDPNGQDLARTDVAQPLLFALQVGVVEALRAQGVEAGLFTGHSVGEIAAAWASGALSLDSAARVVAARSRAQQRTRGMGRMAAVGIDAEACAELLGTLDVEAVIAAVNSPASVTVAGHLADLERVEAEAARRGWLYRLLDLDYPFHTAAMDGLEAEILEDLGDLDAGTSPRFVSAVTGAPVVGPLDAAYWWRNIREPVAFRSAIERLVADGARIFLEIGPAAILQGYVREGLRAADVEGAVLGTLSRRGAQVDPFPEIAGALYTRGYDLAKGPVFDGPAAVRALPKHPWRRERFWSQGTAERIPISAPETEHPLLGFRWEPGGRTWKALLDLDLHPWLADHAVEGAAILPAAAVLELALAAGRAIGGAGGLEVRDLEIPRALTLEAGRPREVRLRVDDDDRFHLESRTRLSDEPWLAHASGRLLLEAGSDQGVTFAGGVSIDVAGLYARADAAGLRYGPHFRTLAAVAAEGDRARARLAGPSPGDGFLLAPNLVDGGLQALLALVEDGAAGETLLPWRIASAKVFAPGATPATATARLVRRGVRSIEGEVSFQDAAGWPVATLSGCWFRRVRLSSRPRLDDRLFRLTSEVMPLEETASPAARLVEATSWKLDPEAVGDGPLMLRAFLDAATSPAAAAELGDPARIWRRALEDEPDLGPALVLAAAQVAHRDGRGQLPSAELTAQVRDRSDAGRAARTLLLERVDAIAAGWPAERPLRVLELGAGEGVLTRALIQRLKARGAPWRYLAADPDADAVAVLARELEAPDAEATTWPLTGHLTFDLVISAQGLRRCDAAADVAEGVGALIASGGVLLACEAAPHPLLADSADWAVRLGGALKTTRRRVASSPWDLDVIEAVAPVRGAAPHVVCDRRGWAVVAPAGHRLAAALEVEGFVRSETVSGDGAVRLWAEGVTDLVVVAPGGPVAAVQAAIEAARAAVEAGARLWLVTEGVHDVSPDAAAVWGVGRTLMNEAPELEVRLVDVMGLPPQAAARRLAAELAAQSPEREVRLTAGGRHAMRLRRGGGELNATAAFVRLDAAEPGRLDSLRWLGSTTAPAPEPGEVVIEVKAAGLNFRDVMWAMDLLPEEALIDGYTGAALGLECAGVVTAVGADVIDVAIGDRVLAFASGALASHVRAAPNAVVRLPDDLGFPEAATLPVAYLTVIYALERVARLQPGEWLLVHGGAGGVGLAAIQYAHHVGARVIATAGSETKREALRLLGVDHVLDSRSLAFADEVRALTGGVDVVLNSLSGAAMARSLELVKPFGRFLELGKRDFFEDTRVGLRPLRRNVSWFAIDVDALPGARPEIAADLLRRTVELVGAGALHPLPLVRYGFSEAAAAFRLMQGAGHIGKIVLTPDDPPAVLPAEPAFQCRADATYLVTGGLSGFGLETAKWLAERGARRLALVGRRGRATPGAGEAVAGLEAKGVEVCILACDVADRAALGAALASIENPGRPLRGVIHAAMQVEDGLLIDLDPDRLETAMAAKVAGAEALDALTADAPLDFFVLYSSAVTLLGAPGQGAYVAANAALETLARRRKREGKPALAIAWGPISDAGFLARESETRTALARRLAATPMPATEALEALGVLVTRDEPVVAYAAVQWDAARQRLPILATPAFQAAAGGAMEESVDLASRLASLDAAEAQAFVTDALAHEVGRILACAPEGLDPKRPLTELGMDSLMAVELRLAVETRLGVSLPLLAMSDSTNLAAIAARVLEASGQAPAARSGIAQAALRHEVEVLPLEPSPTRADVLAAE